MQVKANLVPMVVQPFAKKERVITPIRAADYGSFKKESVMEPQVKIKPLLNYS